MVKKKTTTKKRAIRKRKKKTPVKKKFDKIDAISEIKHAIPHYRCYGCGGKLSIDEVNVFNSHRGYHLACAKKRSFLK